MDPPAPSPRAAAVEGADPAERGRRRPRSILRGALGVAFPIAASFLFSFIVGFAGLALGGLSSTASVSVPSTCRILSTGVDLRSSKVCELGLLNYRAKHIFYPSSNRRFRCHDDYYWASVFQVEYTEYFSGQISYAVAEAPKEALPQNCRPDFGAAWSTTLKFKVNESYSCRYTLGSNKADIHLDKLFNCTAEEPSTKEMLKRIFILWLLKSSTVYYIVATPTKGLISILSRLTEITCTLVLNVSVLCSSLTLDTAFIFHFLLVNLTSKYDRFSESYMSEDFNSERMLGYVAAGVVLGMLSSMLITILLRSFYGLFLAAARWAARKHSISVLAGQFKRACLLVAYVSAVGWITLQYRKFIGLKELLSDSELMERFL